MRGWLIAGALGVAVYLFLRLVAHWALFPAVAFPRGDWDWGAEAGARDVAIVTVDGVRLHAWFFPNEKAKLTTLFFHGNGENLTYRRALTRAVLEAGSELLLVDYRGYGKSEGSPSEVGLYRDADSAYDWLISQGRRADRLVVHGASLGSAVAVDLASRRRVAGVVLESPMTSASDVASRMIPLLGPMLVPGLRNIEKIDAINCPLLIFHGDADNVIPVAMGRAVFDAAAAPKELVVVRGAGHNDIQATARGEFELRLRKFHQKLE